MSYTHRVVLRRGVLTSSGLKKKGDTFESDLSFVPGCVCIKAPEPAAEAKKADSGPAPDAKPAAPAKPAELVELDADYASFNSDRARGYARDLAEEDNLGALKALRALEASTKKRKSVLAVIDSKIESLSE